MANDVCETPDDDSACSEDKFELLERGKSLAAAGKSSESFTYLEKCCSLFAIDRDSHLKEYLRSHYLYACALLDYCQSMDMGSRDTRNDVDRKRQLECNEADGPADAKQTKLDVNQSNRQSDQKGWYSCPFLWKAQVFFEQRTNLAFQRKNEAKRESSSEFSFNQ